MKKKKKKETVMTLLSSLMILLLFAVSKSVTANCPTALTGKPTVTQTSSTEVKVNWSALVKDFDASCMIHEMKIVIKQEGEPER